MMLVILANSLSTQLAEATQRIADALQYVMSEPGGTGVVRKPGTNQPVLPEAEHSR